MLKLKTGALCFRMHMLRATKMCDWVSGEVKSETEEFQLQFNEIIDQISNLPISLLVCAA